MPQRVITILGEKCTYINAGTIEPMHIKDLLTNNWVFAVRQRFKMRIRHMVT